MANNTKMNISYTIRAVDRFSKVHDKLERQFTGLERMAEKLEASREINIDANTATANRNLERTKDKVDDIPRFKTVNVFARGWNDFNNRLNRVANNMNMVDDISRGMMSGGLFTALPALGPLLAGAAGGAGAFASAITSAGVGTAGFAAVAVPEILDVVDANKKLEAAQKAVEEASSPEERQKALEKLTNLQNNYTDAQLESVGALRDFNSFFGDFKAQFQDESLSLFNEGLKGLQRTLELSEPAIQGVADASNRLMDAFNRNLESEDVQRFFEWVGNTAGPNLERLVSGIGNFIAGFGNMMVAFDPLAQSFMDGFLNMSERFRNWTKTLDQNQAFQDFISYVQQHGPTMLDLVGNITKFLVNLGIAMEPLGTKVLELTNALFGWGSELIKNNKWLGIVAGSFMMLRGAIALLSPFVAGGITLFKAFKKPVSALTKRFGGFKGILKRVLPFVKGIGKRLLAFLGPVGLVASAVLTLADIFNIGWGDIAKATQKLWDWMPDWITGPIDTMGQKIIGFFDNITGKANASTGEIKSNTKTDLLGMNNDFTTQFGQMQSTTDSKFGLMAQTASTRSAEMKANAQTNLFGMDSDFMTTLTGMDSTVATKFSNMNSTVGAEMDSMWSTASTDLSTMGADFDSYLSGMDSDVLTRFGNMDSTVSSDMANMQSNVMTNWANASSETTAKNASMQREVARQFAQQYSVVMSQMQSMYSTIQNLWNAAQGFLRSINLYSIGSNIMRGLVRGISSVSVFGAVRSIASSIKGAFTSFFDIHSPSRLMEKDVGRNITLGIIDGLIGMQSKAEREAEAVANAIKRPLDGMTMQPAYAGVAASRSSYQTAMSNKTDGYSTNAAPTSERITVEAPVYLDGYEIARASTKHITREQQREKRIERKFRG